MVAGPEEVQTTADTIHRYLDHCPQASETVEGIARWWLTRQRYNDSLELVQRALDYLEAHGQVEKVNVGKGVVLYKRSKNSNLQTTAMRKPFNV